MMIEWLEDKNDKLTHINKWIPTIKEDKHWDYQYLLIILKKKLEMMVVEFETNVIYESQTEDVVKMKEALLYLNKVIEDDYDFPDFLRGRDEKQEDFNTFLTILSEELFKWWS